MKLTAFKIGGEFEIGHYRGNRCLSAIKIHNTTTATGKAEVAGLINEVTSVGFKWLALDSSSTAATAADTALASEITGNGLARLLATSTRVTTDDTNDTAQLVKTWTATGDQAVRGVGVFDTSTSGGVMLARTTFAVKNMENLDSLKITYKFDID